jgi:hypothetical protein
LRSLAGWAGKTLSNVFVCLSCSGHVQEFVSTLFMSWMPSLSGELHAESNDGFFCSFLVLLARELFCLMLACFFGVPGLGLVLDMLVS